MTAKTNPTFKRRDVEVVPTSLPPLNKLDIFKKLKNIINITNITTIILREILLIFIFFPTFYMLATYINQLFTI